ncbi:hypothetical protein B9479_007496 [Cryptococcus floricola]|uniref:GH16 domain-containing protein n=1 Tax=Cryptococcus floricola TaxID=2591691 RepID=A0A5D3AK38_9TREE|nr:hypothetical protein B9479_007496 [Cryptococcus floricola]
MAPSRSFLPLLLSASTLLVSAQTTTTTSSTTHYTAKSALKLAKSYVGDDFLNDFDYFTDDDPTSGTVNYVSKSSGQSAGLIDVQSDSTFIMRADSDSVATGRGRDSVRISSKDYFADGVYILDLNHMPVGCGTWPAFWTVTKNGWPVGGEIDILEGANGLPVQYSSAWNATTGISANATGQTVNTVALHTSDTCTIEGGSYMNGQVGETACSAYVSGNTGCGVKMDGGEGATNGTYGSGVNSEGGGWYAMWRDLENSGSINVWFWPRGSATVPDDVKNVDTATTKLAGWGTPNANFSIPTCTSDFNKHVIVFDLTFCGDYAGATYTSAGCPGTCSTFVTNTPSAFTEAYWSLNSLRVYTASGKSVSSSSSLSSGAIAGIVVGSVVGVALIVFAFLWWRRSQRRKRLGMGKKSLSAGSNERIPFGIPTVSKQSYKDIAARKPRTGPTKLAPGKRAHDYLQGETPVGMTPSKSKPYGGGRSTAREGGSSKSSPASSDVKLNVLESKPGLPPSGGRGWVG